MNNRQWPGSGGCPPAGYLDPEPAGESQHAGSGISTRQRLHVLLKYKWVIVACLVCSIGAAHALRLLLAKPSFLATSQLLVAPGREHVTDFSLATGGAVPPWVRFSADEESARTVELLMGRFLAERVVRTIGADVLYPVEREPVWLVHASLQPARADSPQEREQAAIGRFMDGVTASAVSRSGIVQLTFTHHDPKLAARAVNLLADLYIERYLVVHQDPRANAFFEEQFTTLKHDLRESEARLLDFKQQHGITTSVIEEQSALRQVQADLRAELTETRSRQAELDSRAGALRQQMYQHGTRYGSLQEDLLRNDAEARASRARADALTRKIGDLQRRLDDLERLRDDYSHLEKQLKSDEDSYRLYLAKFEEARIAQAMDNERIVSVRVIERAPVPSRPMRSRLDRLAPLSVPAGLFGGIALALLLHWMRRTLDTAEDVERTLNLPVLASIAE